MKLIYVKINWALVELDICATHFWLFILTIVFN